jgi:hypothetical protein
MHQIEVHIICYKIVQRLLQSRFDIIRVMLIAPELGGDEDILTWDAAFLDAFSYGFLCFIPCFYISARSSAS